MSLLPVLEIRSMKFFLIFFLFLTAVSTRASQIDCVVTLINNFKDSTTADFSVGFTNILEAQCLSGYRLTFKSRGPGMAAAIAGRYAFSCPLVDLDHIEGDYLGGEVTCGGGAGLCAGVFYGEHKVCFFKEFFLEAEFQFLAGDYRLVA